MVMRNVLRAGVVLISGLLIGFTWPAAATALGIVTILSVAWRSRHALAAATPYLVTGVLLVAAGPAIVVITPSQATEELHLGPIQACTPSATWC